MLPLFSSFSDSKVHLRLSAYCLFCFFSTATELSISFFQVVVRICSSILFVRKFRGFFPGVGGVSLLLLLLLLPSTCSSLLLLLLAMLCLFVFTYTIHGRCIQKWPYSVSQIACFTHKLLEISLHREIGRSQPIFQDIYVTAQCLCLLVE